MQSQVPGGEVHPCRPAESGGLRHSASVRHSPECGHGCASPNAETPLHQLLNQFLLPILTRTRPSAARCQALELAGTVRNGGQPCHIGGKTQTRQVCGGKGLPVESRGWPNIYKPNQGAILAPVGGQGPQEPPQDGLKRAFPERNSKKRNAGEGRDIAATPQTQAKRAPAAMRSWKTRRKTTGLTTGISSRGRQNDPC